MTLNTEKAVHMTDRNKRRPLLHCYVCNENMLKHVGSYKYLGITITRDFRWDADVNNAVTKANTKVHFKAGLKRAS